MEQSVPSAVDDIYAFHAAIRNDLGELASIFEEITNTNLSSKAPVAGPSVLGKRMSVQIFLLPYIQWLTILQDPMHHLHWRTAFRQSAPHALRPLLLSRVRHIVRRRHHARRRVIPHPLLSPADPRRPTRPVHHTRITKGVREEGGRVHRTRERTHLLHQRGVPDIPRVVFGRHHNRRRVPRMRYDDVPAVQAS